MNIDLIPHLLPDIYKRDTLMVQPLFDDFSGSNPIIRAALLRKKDVAQKYTIHGKIRVPNLNGFEEIPLQSILTLINHENDPPEIVECGGVALLGTWNLAHGVVLSEANVRLHFKNGTIVAHLSGALRVTDSGGIETGGALDGQIYHDSEDPERVYIGTLVPDAYLHIGSSIRFRGATIRFEFCTRPHDPSKSLPFRIDDMDEMLIQCSEPIPLASWHISGIGDKPITMSINVNALTPGRVQTSLSVFPVRLRIPFLGENSYLFIAGQEGGSSFSLDLTEQWGAFISSSPDLYLILPADPGGPSLIEGISFFTGRLDAVGLSQATLSISSELIEATAFPSSKWPQKMPAQKISFSLSATGNVSLFLKLNPLIIDDFSILSNREKEDFLEAELFDKGLKFKKGYRMSQGHPKKLPRELPAFFIDNYCRVWVEAGAGVVDLKTWVKAGD